MTVWLYLWHPYYEEDLQFVLFDGGNTYWHDEMRPSGGYDLKKMKKRFIYVGEL